MGPLPAGARGLELRAVQALVGPTPPRRIVTLALFTRQTEWQEGLLASLAQLQLQFHTLRSLQGTVTAALRSVKVNHLAAEFCFPRENYPPESLCRARAENRALWATKS